MSTVIEHLKGLRERADALVAEGLPGHGNRQDDRSFQFQALLLVSVHLEELEALATAGVPEARTDHIRSVPGGAAFLRVAGAAGVPGTFKDQQEQPMDEHQCVITIWNRQFDVVPYYRERGFKVLPPDLTMQGHDLKRLGGVPGDRTLTRQRDQKVIGDMETVIVQPGDDFDATPPATGSFR